MKTADGTIFFKEWLPDLPALDNPGLTEAQNVRPLEGSYKNFNPLGAAQAGSTLGSAPLGGIIVGTPSNSIVYAGLSTALAAATGGAFTMLSANTYGATTWDFAIFENLVCASDINTPIQAHTVGSASNFATLGSSSGTAPGARCIGKVGQFLVAGGLVTEPYSVRWCGIGNPQSWPTPGSSTAIAQQAGQQDLDNFGPVRAVRGGDQFGIIWQSTGMHRMTYVGGDTVFQFDVISKHIGTTLKNSIIHYGGLWYFASVGGFFVTDGVTVSPIGVNKVDQFFLTQFLGAGNENGVYASIDHKNKLIYWAYPLASGGAGFNFADEILVYNVVEKRFSRATTLLSCLPFQVNYPLSSPILAIDSNFAIAYFNGTPVNTGRLITAEAEFNRGGKTFVQGVKPLVDLSIATATVALGYRDDQSSSPTFTAETTANSRSGFADFRNEARYHRARVTISGTFNSAQGLEYQAVPTGAL